MKAYVFDNIDLIKGLKSQSLDDISLFEGKTWNLIVDSGLIKVEFANSQDLIVYDKDYELNSFKWHRSVKDGAIEISEDGKLQFRLFPIFCHKGLMLLQKDNTSECYILVKRYNWRPIKYKTVESVRTYISKAVSSSSEKELTIGNDDIIFSKNVDVILERRYHSLYVLDAISCSLFMLIAIVSFFTGIVWFAIIQKITTMVVVSIALFLSISVVNPIIDRYVMRTRREIAKEIMERK